MRRGGSDTGVAQLRATSKRPRKKAPSPLELPASSAEPSWAPGRTIKKLIIEAKVNMAKLKTCSACYGPAPVVVSMSVAGEGAYLLCHTCADRIGGQSSRLSDLVRAQMEDPNLREMD